MLSKKVNIVILIIAISFAFVNFTFAQDCGGHGTLNDGNCCCDSGYSATVSSVPTDCDHSDSSCFAGAVVPGDFGTNAKSYLAETSFDDNTLSFAVYSPIVLDRTCTSVVLGSDSSQSVCSNSLKTIGNCQDHWNFAIDWSDAVEKCGFELDTTSDAATNEYADYYLYVNEVVVTTTDHLDDDGTTRVEVAYLGIRVIFPKSVTATASISVISSIALSTSLIAQTTSPETSSSQATLVFQTTVQWPYRLNLRSDPSVPSGFSLSSFIETTTTGCPTTPDSACVQQWTVVETTTTKCVLDGEYDLIWNQGCRSSAGNECPFANGDSPRPTSQIQAQLYSENFCADVDSQINITPSLNSYADGSSSAARGTYVQEDIAYYVFSVDSTQSTVTSVNVTSVSITDSNNLNIGFLYDKTSGGLTTNGNTAQFTLAAGDTASSTKFHFKLASSLFNVQVPTSMTVSASVVIGYEGNNRKREITFSETVDTSVKSSQSSLLVIEPIVVAASNETSVDHEATSSAVSISLSTIFFAVSLMVALIL